jgi:O-antigen ligase
MQSLDKIIHSRYFLMVVSTLPFLLITGPFLSDLLVSCSAVFFLIYVISYKKYYLFKNYYFFFFLLFYVLIILSSLISIDPLLSFESSLFYFRVIIFSYLISYLINYNKILLIYFYNTLFFCFSILIFDGYIQYTFGKNIFLIPSDYGKIASFFGTEGVLGSFLARLFPLFFALFLIKKKKKYEKFLIATIFIFLDVLIFLTGERAAFFLLNLSTIFIIILITEYKIFRLITFLVSLVIIFGITMLNDGIKERMIKEPLSSFQPETFNSKNQELVGKKIFTYEHSKIYFAAYEMFKDKPILGHGPKLFRIVCKDYKYDKTEDACSTHPHNFYLQLLAETGLLGFIFIIIAFFFVLKEAILILLKKKYVSSQEICLLGAFFLTLWPLTPNGNLFNNWLMIVYFMPLGFYLNLKLFKKYSKKKKFK